MPAGRPTKYKPNKHPERAYRLTLLGFTDKELADCFDVEEATITNWKREHPEFFSSIKKGKAYADAKVADRLYQRAMGYTHPEEKIFNNNGEIIRAETVKHYPPDPTAAIFWLKNRQRGKWKDVKQSELTGRGGGPIETKEIKELTNAELAAIAAKAVEDKD